MNTIVLDTSLLSTKLYFYFYRFPSGNILLYKREYFVTQVKRKAVQNVPQQDKGGSS